MNLFDVTGKVALVTGGSSGIGAMIARGYVEAGMRVYIASRKKTECDRVAAELGPTCIPLSADLSTMEGITSLAAELTAREPHLDVLVNNAGATWGAPLDAYPEAGWDRVMDLNVKATFFLTQKLIPLLDKASSPRVINISSMNGITPPPMETFAYSSSKAAVIMLTRHLAKRLAPKILVNAIAPGPFQSRMMAATLEIAGDAIVSAIPMHRLGSPEDVAGCAIFLASRASAYTTGAVIPCDGGASQV